MKMLYISKSLIPSDTANSINVMKMCEAFANNGCDVDLLIPDNKQEQEKEESPYEFYGVKKIFSIHKIPPITKSLKRVTNYPNLIKTHIKLRKPKLLYFRDNSIKYNLHEIGIPMVIEIHREITKHENIFNNYTKSEDLKKIIVINKYLFDYYKNIYSITIKTNMKYLLIKS